MRNVTMYCLCIHNKVLPVIKKLDYIPVGLGNDKISVEWLRDNTNENISSKNKYYSEYSFHYWFWKNVLPKIEDNHWVGFCAYRRYWCNKEKFAHDSIIDELAVKIDDVVIKDIPYEWKKFDTLVG